MGMYPSEDRGSRERIYLYTGATTTSGDRQVLLNNVEISTLALIKKYRFLMIQFLGYSTAETSNTYGEHYYPAESTIFDTQDIFNGTGASYVNSLYGNKFCQLTSVNGKVGAYVIMINTAAPLNMGIVVYGFN